MVAPYLSQWLRRPRLIHCVDNPDLEIKREAVSEGQFSVPYESHIL